MRQEERQKAERADQAKQEGHEVYLTANARCPLLRTYAISPLVLTSDQMFRFAVEYEFNETDDFYLAIALHDIRRGGITFDTGAHNPKLHMTKKGRHTVYFEMPLDLFNNGEFRLFTSLRTPIKAIPKRRTWSLSRWMTMRAPLRYVIPAIWTTH